MAIVREFGLGRSIAILKAVQNHLYALRVQCLYLVKNDNHPAVVRRVRNIE